MLPGHFSCWLPPFKVPQTSPPLRQMVLSPFFGAWWPCFVGHFLMATKTGMVYGPLLSQILYQVVFSKASYPKGAGRSGQEAPLSGKVPLRDHRATVGMTMLWQRAVGKCFQRWQYAYGTNYTTWIPSTQVENCGPRRWNTWLKVT